ncbi:hypothetical protein [Moorena producens]|uniref:hypothetical protein n=1 Tax=Moorena producens TaxID=1155739 RepID=UPI003C7071D4
MGNGEWAMGNGEWGIGNGEWAIGNGEWGIGNGEWAIGNGQWGMGNRQWGMGNGSEKGSRSWVAEQMNYVPLEQAKRVSRSYEVQYPLTLIPYLDAPHPY